MDTAMDFTPDMLLPASTPDTTVLDTPDTTVLDTPDTTVLDTPDLDMDTMVLDTLDILMDMSSSPPRRPPMRPLKKPKKSTRNILGLSRHYVLSLPMYFVLVLTKDLGFC